MVERSRRRSPSPSRRDSERERPRQEDYGREIGRDARAEETDDPPNLFVGHLSFSTSDDRLREVFEQTGNVLSATIMRDPHDGRPRGFGFVQMATEADTDEAVSRLNGTTVDGQVIRVERVSVTAWIFSSANVSDAQRVRTE